MMFSRNCPASCRNLNVKFCHCAACCLPNSTLILACLQQPAPTGHIVHIGPDGVPVRVCLFCFPQSFLLGTIKQRSSPSSARNPPSETVTSNAARIYAVFFSHRTTLVLSTFPRFVFCAIVRVKVTGSKCMRARKVGVSPQNSYHIYPAALAKASH